MTRVFKVDPDGVLREHKDSIDGETVPNSDYVPAQYEALVWNQKGPKVCKSIEEARDWMKLE